MNIISRAPLNRGYAPKPNIGITKDQQQSPSRGRLEKGSQVEPISLCPPHVNKINFISDHNATTRVQTNAVYDSRKEEMKTQNLEDWKILTLKQIKRSKICSTKQQREQSRNKSQQKLHVSISRSNRSKSKEQPCSTPSNSQVSNGHFAHLAHLSKKRYIVEKVENQIEVEGKSYSIFCD